MDTFILRPISASDIDAFHELVQSISEPIASLPDDRDLLTQRIQLSEDSFNSTPNSPSKEYYLFILENVNTKEIIGCSAFAAKSGGSDSFFAYEIQKEHFEHPPLNIAKDVEVLHFKTLPNAPAEACSLYMHPNYRNSGQAPLLAFGRYIFAALYPERFPKNIVAILRGARNKESKSPFWRALGKVFFEGTLSSADTMKSFGNKEFIKDLMPRHPIYVPLLPQVAQDAIQEVHTTTKPALHLLKKIGFTLSQYVDIFDAGPIPIANFKDISIIKNLKSTTLKDTNDTIPDTDLFLVATTNPSLAITYTPLQRHPDNSISLPSQAAEALGLRPGEEVVYSHL